jgi:hypothetical protein
MSLSGPWRWQGRDRPTGTGHRARALAHPDPTGSGAMICLMTFQLGLGPDGVGTLDVEEAESRSPAGASEPAGGLGAADLDHRGRTRRSVGSVHGVERVRAWEARPGRLAW